MPVGDVERGLDSGHIKCKGFRELLSDLATGKKELHKRWQGIKGKDAGSNAEPKIPDKCKLFGDSTGVFGANDKEQVALQKYTESFLGRFSEKLNGK